MCNLKMLEYLDEKFDYNSSKLFTHWRYALRINDWAEEDESARRL